MKNWQKLVATVPAFTRGRKLIDWFESQGFAEAGYGANKTVLSHDDCDYVVKVFRHPGMWYYDLSTCGIAPGWLVPHWMQNLHVGRRFVIQPRVELLTETIMYNIRSKAIGPVAWIDWDIHHQNCGVLNGVFKIIDYGHYEDSKLKWRWPSLTLNRIIK